MDSGETNQHGDGGDDFKVDQRLDAEAADFLQVGVAGDAHHEDAEEERRDYHFDEAKKNRAEELQVDCDGGPVVAKLRSVEKADENPSGQRASRSGVSRDEQDR